MVTNIKDTEGRIVAIAEWRLVGDSGLECTNGRYIWLNDIWIHDAYRNKRLLNRIIDEIMTIVPEAQYCYFQRKDINDKIHIYSRRHWERRRNAYYPAIVKEP